MFPLHGTHTHTQTHKHTHAHTHTQTNRPLFSAAHEYCTILLICEVAPLFVGQFVLRANFDWLLLFTGRGCLYSSLSWTYFNNEHFSNSVVALESKVNAVVQYLLWLETRLTVPEWEARRALSMGVLPMCMEWKLGGIVCSGWGGAYFRWKRWNRPEVLYREFTVEHIPF
jgi:hypothetical protein